MNNIFDTEDERVVLFIPKTELMDAFRSVVDELLSKKEEQKKDVLLSRKAVSERLKVDYTTLWRWDKEKFLEATRIGKACFYKEQDVIAIEEGRI